MPQNFAYSARFEREGEISAESATDAALALKHQTPEGYAFQGATIAAASDDAPSVAFDATAMRPLDLRNALTHPGADDRSVKITFYDRQAVVCSVELEGHPKALAELSAQIVACYNKGLINL